MTSLTRVIVYVCVRAYECIRAVIGKDGRQYSIGVLEDQTVWQQAILPQLRRRPVSHFLALKLLPHSHGVCQSPYHPSPAGRTICLGITAHAALKYL
jgi:hypothetical protein